MNLYKDTLDIGEPKDIDESKLEEFSRLTRQYSIRPSKLFIVGKKRFLRIYMGSINEGFHDEEFGHVVPRSIKRGDILDSFSKIEFIINEIISSAIAGGDISHKGIKVDDLSIKIDLSQKIHILKEWHFIGEETFQKLMKLRNVRNVLAHSWEFNNAVYGKDQTLKTNFKQFQEDLREVWKRLIVVYENVRPQNQLMDNLINELKGMIKNAINH